MTRLETPVRERPAQARAHDPAREASAGDARARGVAAIAARLAAAGLVIATGAIHLYLYQSFMSQVPTVGRLFLANFVAALVLGGLIVVRPRALWSALGAAFCLGTLGAFLVSVHWGLFGYQETLRGAWQERAAGVELAGAVAGSAAAALTWRRSRRRTARSAFSTSSAGQRRRHASPRGG